MQVNTSIWGASDTWVTPSASDIQSGSVAEIKKAADAQDTYKENYDGGRIPLNDIDFSPSFYGIGKDCIFCNPYYIAPYADGGDLTKPKIDVRPVLDQKKDRPLMFITNNQSSSNIQYSNRFAPDLSSVTSNATSNSRMVLDFNYQKVFIIPQIYYAADNFHNSVTNTYRWGLYEYFANYVEASNINHILGLGYRVYVGDADSRTLANAGIKAYTIFDDVKGYEGTYDNVPFYAQYGMKTPAILGHAVDSNRYCQVCKYNDTRTTRNATVGTADTGFRFKYCKANNTAVAWYYYEPDNPLWQVQIEEIASGNTYWNPIPFIKVTTANKDDVYKYLLKQIAYLGLPFLYGDTVENYNYGLGSEHYALPVFDDNGVTTGDFKTGDDARLLKNSLWTDPRTSGYTPGSGSSLPNQDSGDLNNYQLHNLRYHGSNNYYLLTEGELSQFIAFINGLYVGESDPQEKRDIDFMGSNPTDYIVGIYGMGIELFGSGSIPIKLGAIDTNDIPLLVKVVEQTTSQYVTFGSYDIPALGNFMDYKPYTQIEVYVPLCGTIEVDPADYVGHNLKVDALVDLQTGEMTARIIRDNKTITNTLTGSCWVQLPVTAARMGDYQNNQHQLRMQMLSSLLNFTSTSSNAIGSDAQNAAAAIAGGSGSSGAPSSIGKAQFIIPQAAAGTALDLYNTHYQITHTQPTRSVASSASSGNALDMYHHAMVFIKRPQMLASYDPQKYAHTIGHACCITGSLSRFTGYTVISAANLDNIHTKSVTPLQATAQEKQLLRRALQAGIYI